MGKGIKLIKSLEVNLVHLSHHLGINKSSWERIWLNVNNMTKCQVVFNALKAKSSNEWFFDNGYSRHMIGDKTYFNSLENNNGGTITFGYGSLVWVKDKSSIAIPSCPKLDRDWIQPFWCWTMSLCSSFPKKSTCIERQTL